MVLPDIFFYEMELAVCIFVCLGLYLLGYSVDPIFNQKPPDFASALIMVFTLLKLNDFRMAHTPPARKLWTFPVNIFAGILMSQVALFVIWKIIWHFAEVSHDWLMTTEAAMGLLISHPCIYGLLKEDLIYIIKLIIVGSFTYKTIKNYVLDTPATIVDIINLSKESIANSDEPILNDAVNEEEQQQQQQQQQQMEEEPPVLVETRQSRRKYRRRR